MGLKDYTKEELAAMSYDDIAFLILQESGKKMKITNLFKKVCATLKLSDEIYETKIADFFELLSTDRKFIMLEDGAWDLRDKHSTKIKIESDDEETINESTEDLEDIDLDDEDEEEDIFYENEEGDDEPDNDLKDLVVIDDEEESNS